jgi:hypothetical protein
MESLQNSYQTFNEKLIPMLHKLFHELERIGTLPNTFYEALVILITKSVKNKTKTRIISKYLS